ncbi:hypothetical protein BH23GEM3_BH23GEM3_19830 [soil metagenome]
MEEQDWQPTGERRWRVVRRVGGFRKVRSERGEIDLNSGERRWVPLAHGTELRKKSAGWARLPVYERMEIDDRPDEDILPWGYDQGTRD